MPATRVARLAQGHSRRCFTLYAGLPLCARERGQERQAQQPRLIICSCCTRQGLMQTARQWSVACTGSGLSG
eukprot:237674-Chlamydomonas_euryale.AAC.6